MKKQTVVRWIWGILFAICEIFLLIATFHIDGPFSERVFGFFTFSLLLLFIFFWLSSLTACLFEKNNPQRWRDFVIILLLNIFGAVYFRRARQIRNYQPPKDPATFNQKFSKWLDENHFSLEKCVEQRRKSAAFGTVMLALYFVFLTLGLGLKYALFFVPEWLSPFVLILPMLGLLAFFLRYVYRDWKRTDRIPFLLSMMFLQADAGNNTKGMIFFDKQEPYHKKPPLSFILMGDLFLFFFITFGMSIFTVFSADVTMMDTYLAIGGTTITLLFLLVFLQFQTAWFVYFYPNSIFSVIKHYQAWKTAGTLLATLPILGFMTMFIIISIPGVINYHSP
ncbi:MAG: hypothetical protein CR975_03525 [Gammaproteobacteria bacterium]|nr:MAG: hypothetical protein CR975_03525 [Gammaproteobacteria bacterium]